MNYITIPTVVGAAKLRNASLLGQKVDITRVAFGDGDGAEYEPTGQETALKKQVYECPPNRIEEEAGAPSWIELEAVIPHNVGGWYLREVGCFDDEGDLIFIGNLPSSFKPAGEAGVIKDLVFEMVYDAVAADVVQIKIDPNVVVATRKYVDDQDKAHTDNQIKNMVGLIGEFHSASAKPGWVDLKGGELSRTTDKLLWDYAVAAGMTVAQATKDADPMANAMKFGDGDGATTFTLPNHHLGHFTRGTPNGVNHGETQGDAIRNIEASAAFGDNVNNTGALVHETRGAFYGSQHNGVWYLDRNPIPESRNNARILHFNAARTVPTANENRPYTANISIKIHRGWM